MMPDSRHSPEPLSDQSGSATKSPAEAAWRADAARRVLPALARRAPLMPITGLTASEVPGSAGTTTATRASKPPK